MVVDPTVEVMVDPSLVMTDSIAEVVIADEEPPVPVPELPAPLGDVSSWK